MSDMDKDMVFVPNSDLWFAAFIWWQKKQPAALTLEGYLKNPCAGVTDDAEKILAEAVARGIAISQQNEGEYERTLIEDRNRLLILLVAVADAIEAGEVTQELADMIREQAAK